MSNRLERWRSRPHHSSPWLTDIYRHVLIKWFKMFLAVCVCVFSIRVEVAVHESGDCRLSLYELINSFSFSFPALLCSIPPLFPCCAQREYMHHSTLLLSARCPIGQLPPYSSTPLSCCFICLSVPWMKWRHHCSRSSGYLPQHAFT